MQSSNQTGHFNKDQGEKERGEKETKKNAKPLHEILIWLLVKGERGGTISKKKHRSERLSVNRAVIY